MLIDLLMTVSEARCGSANCSGERIRSNVQSMGC